MVNASSILGIAFFSISLIFSVIVLVDTRGRLDPAMIAICIAYLVSFGLRLPFLSSDVLSQFIQSFAHFTLTAFMYFFVFEMRRLKDII